MKATFLISAVKWQGLGSLTHPANEPHVNDVDRDVACPQANLPLIINRRGGCLGQVAVLDDLNFTVDVDDVANFFHGVSFADDLRRHLAARHDVMTDQRRITEADQRIVDLEIGQMFDAASFRIIQASVALQRRNGAAMTIGTECQGFFRR